MAPLFPARGAPRAIAQLTQPKSLMSGPILDARVEQKGLAMTTPVQLFFGLTEDATLAGQIRGMQAYVGMWLAYACMKFRATKLVEAPLVVMAKSKDGEAPLEGDHPLSKLLEQPNPDMDMAELLELVSLYLDHGGRALLVKNRDRGKRVGSMYAFSRDEFIVSRDRGQLYGRFEVSTQAGFKVYGPEDVVFFQEADPRLIRTGIGPLDVALSHINIGEEMRKAVSAALKNAIRPGSVVEVPDSLSEPDFKRLKEEINSMVAGTKNNGKNMLLDKGAKLNMLERALKDLELGPVQGDIEAAICAVFEVHPSLIGTKLAMENSSGLSDTIKPATELFYDRVCFPRWGKLERTLTRSLLREIDADLSHVMRFDRSKIRELQDDMTARTKEAQQAAQFWTVDEQRAHTNKKPIGGEKGGKLGIEARPAPTAAPGQQPPKDKKPPATKARPFALANKAMTQEERDNAWQSFDTKAAAQEPTYERVAKALFAMEASTVTALFNVKADDDLLFARALAKIDELYGKRGGIYSAWNVAYTELITDTLGAAGKDLAGSVGVGFDVTNPQVHAMIAVRAASMVQHVTETTRTKLHAVITKAHADGVGVSGMAKRIREDAFDDETTAARAKMIAQTETVGAMNAGELAAAIEAGLGSKEWLTQGDARVRSDHRKLDGQKRGIDERFDNGLQYPGETGVPAKQVVNCRCTLLFSDEEPAE